MNNHLISSVRVSTVGNHDRVEIWNRGGKAGELTVKDGDGGAIARRLVSGCVCNTDTRGTETTWRVVGLLPIEPA